MRPPLPRLHAVTDAALARRPDLDEVARALADGGADELAFHARGRALSGREHLDLAGRLSACAPARLFVNDRLDVALAAGAVGVQLGRGSLRPADARRCDPEWWIGVSVHDLDEAEAARDAGADYLLAGPVYATASHPDRAPIGRTRLEEIVALGVRVVAIGGITVERVRELQAAGVWGVAAIRALWDAPDPEAAARALVRQLE
ncbi:MAG TPA: thiamine phosphate synthase [Gemmatimonadales bacterium]